jgi:hypothetical protein
MPEYALICLNLRASNALDVLLRSQVSGILISSKILVDLWSPSRYVCSDLTSYSDKDCI